MYSPYTPDPRLSGMYPWMSTALFRPPQGGSAPISGFTNKLSLAPQASPSPPPASPPPPRFGNVLDEYTTPGSELDAQGRPLTGVNAQKQQFLNGNLFRPEGLWQGAPGDDPSQPSIGFRNFLQGYAGQIGQFSYLPPGIGPSGGSTGGTMKSVTSGPNPINREPGDGITPPPPGSPPPGGPPPAGPPPGGPPSLTYPIANVSGNPAARGNGPNIPGYIPGMIPGSDSNFPYNPNPPSPPGTWGDLYNSLFSGSLNPNEQRSFNRNGLDPRLDSVFSYAMQEAMSRYADPEGMQFYQGPTVAGFTPAEQQAQQMLLGQAGSLQTGGGLDYVNTMLQRARDPNTDTTVQPMIDAMSKDAMQQFTDPNGPLANLRNESINNGAYGGTRQGVMEGVLQGRLADAIAKNSADIRLQSRNQNLSAASQALTQMNPAITAATAPATIMGSVGTQQRDMNQANMNDALKRWFYNTTMPDTRLSNLYSMLGATPLGGYQGNQGFYGSDLIQRVGSPTTAQNVAGGLAGAAALWALLRGT